MAVFDTKFADRWKYDDDYEEATCPICGQEYEADPDELKEIWHYCPRCGHRLLIPINMEDE